MDPILLRMKRRLERAELLHLREHAAELAARIEDVESRLADAEADADFWRQQVLDLQDTLSEAGTGHALGLTQSGAVVLVPPA